MRPMKLTKALAPASFQARPNSGCGETGWGAMRSNRLEKAAMGMLGASALSVALTGCINIAAPDEPIVIELNINIQQEVIYRLAEDAADTVEENADIF